VVVALLLDARGYEGRVAGVACAVHEGVDPAGDVVGVAGVVLVQADRRVPLVAPVRRLGCGQDLPGLRPGGLSRHHRGDDPHDQHCAGHGGDHPAAVVPDVDREGCHRRRGQDEGLRPEEPEIVTPPELGDGRAPDVEERELR